MLIDIGCPGHVHRLLFTRVILYICVGIDGTRGFKTRSDETRKKWKMFLVLYDYDNNTINPTPMKNKGYKEMVCAYDLLIHALIDRGSKPLLQFQGPLHCRALLL
jgi:hypothetical protein